MNTYKVKYKDGKVTKVRADKYTMGGYHMWFYKHSWWSGDTEVAYLPAKGVESVFIEDYVEESVNEKRI